MLPLPLGEGWGEGSWDDAAKARSAARIASNDKEWTETDPNLPKSPWWLTDGRALSLGMRIIRPLDAPTAAEQAKFWDADVEQIRDATAQRKFSSKPVDTILSVTGNPYRSTFSVSRSLTTWNFRIRVGKSACSLIETWTTPLQKLGKLQLCFCICMLMVTVSHAEGPATAATQDADPANNVHTASWGTKLRQAGITGLVQLAVSLFGGVFVFERLFRLRQRYLVPKGLADHARTLWAAGKFDELERLKDTHPSTLSRVISFIAANRRLPMSDVSAIAGELVSRELDIQNQKAYPLGIVATISPLLGLLGMILGMIDTFETVALAGSLGDPTQLAAGISEALVTTGLGLAIAIPFLSLYHFFKYRTAGFGVQLEEQVTGLLTAWLMKPEANEAVSAWPISPLKAEAKEEVSA